MTKNQETLERHLQDQIIQEFGPRFAPNGLLYYLREAAHKEPVVDKDGIERLSILSHVYEKLPDVVIYDKQRQWIFLIEAAVSGGHISPKRHAELEEIFRGCPASRVYITACPNRKAYKRFLADIAWGTAIWFADEPDHLVHYSRKNNPAHDRYQQPSGEVLFTLHTPILDSAIGQADSQQPAIQRECQSVE